MNRLFSVANSIQPLTKEAWLALSSICSTHELSKGYMLQSIGQTCKTIYFIEEGCARIFYYKDDIDITEHFAFENNFIARLESLFTGRPSRKGIQILENSVVISLNANALNKLYNVFPEIDQLFRRIYTFLINYLLISRGICQAMIFVKRREYVH
jgi:CRP-like cAMP-binding protein